MITEISQKIKSKFIVEIRSPLPDNLINSWSTTIKVEPSDKLVSLRLFERQMTLEGKLDVLKELTGNPDNLQDQKSLLETHWLFENIDRRSIQILVEKVQNAKDFEKIAGTLKKEKVRNSHLT